MAKVSIKLVFRYGWGFYYSQHRRVLYILPIPMLGVRIKWGD